MMKNWLVVSIRSTIYKACEVDIITHFALVMFEFAKTFLHFRKKSVFIFRLFKKFIIKKLVNSVFAFYHELSNIVTVLFASTFCFGFDNSSLTSSDNRFLVAEAKKKKQNTRVFHAVKRHPQKVTKWDKNFSEDLRTTIENKILQ